MKGLTSDDFKIAAGILGTNVYAVMAVAEVEAAGSGFFPNGQPKILFEAHIFSRLTNHRYDLTHPNISSPKWSKVLYLGGAQEHTRLQAAVTLDRDAALQSASWGMFQIMGFNYTRCGMPDLQTFINRMYESEGQQLRLFCNFVVSMGLADELQRNDWAGFARVYNGPSYAENQYDTKLSRAYTRLTNAETAVAR